MKLKTTGVVLMCTAVLALVVGLREFRGDDPRMRLEISRAERELYVYIDGERVATHPVAIGQPEHPTPTGSWGIHQIDWNPDWTPPDSPWAADASYTPPGHPDNPMGRARLMFDPPYTIHGTTDVGSLGHAASHGSVRVSNDVVIALGKAIMRHGDASQDEAWVDRVLEDPTTMRSVQIPNPIPVRIRD